MTPAKKAMRTKKQPMTIAGICVDSMDALIEFLPLFEKPKFLFGRWERCLFINNSGRLLLFYGCGYILKVCFWPVQQFFFLSVLGILRLKEENNGCDKRHGKGESKMGGEGFFFSQAMVGLWW